MTYLTMTLGKLSATHFNSCRSERLSLVDMEEGEGRPASPNFYGTGNDPVPHGNDLVPQQQTYPPLLRSRIKTS
jgi:hypothetical protein